MTSPDINTKAPLAERLVFSKRPVVMLFMLIATVLLAWQASRLDIHNPAACLRLFHANREVGLAVALALLLGRL
mgnify:CR=1 FL=1